MHKSETFQQCIKKTTEKWVRQSTTNPVEETVEVHMHSVAIGGVKQNVFAMAIAKSKHVANHADHSSCACVGYPCIVPGMQQKTDMTLSLF